MSLRVAIAILLTALPCVSSSQRHADSPRVLLITVDGLKAEYLTRADDYDLQIPALRALMSAGTTSTGVVPPTPSNTMPGHVTLVTGSWPARHGILDNDRFAPATEDDTRIYHYYSDIEVPTLFDVANEAGLLTAAIGWPVATGAPVPWLSPESPGGVPEIEKFLYATTTPNLRAVLDKLPEDDDERRFALASAALAARPDFLALHVGETDEAQHDHGPESAEALAAIELLDRRLGRFLRDACDAGHLADTNVVVTADHGFRRLHTGVFLMPLFRTLGLLTTDENDEITDWLAYPWPAAGASPIYLTDPADPELRARADRALEFIEHELGDAIARIYRDSELNTIHGFPDAYAVIALRAGYAFGGGFDNPLRRTPTMTKGIHGYVPDGPDMHAALVVAAPTAEPGSRIGIVDMTDIAPTIARWLGLDLGEIDGSPIASLLPARSVPASGCDTYLPASDR